MKRNHWVLRLAALMLASYSLLLVTAAAAGGAGSETDPLVTLSYLNETFMAQLLGGVDEKLAVRDAELSARLSGQVQQDTAALEEKYGTGTATGTAAAQAESFTVVTLSNGQTLYGAIGCEAMLRVGTASCVASSSPGLIDETDASSLGGGKALVKNHLYMMTVDERGVKATADTVKLLVRGAYTIQ